MTLATIRVYSHKKTTIQRGHPWIFPKAIAKIINQPKTGELVLIEDENKEAIGFGVYNEHSLYRVRVLSLMTTSQEQPSLESIITHKLKAAIMLRQSLLLPSEATTAYRLFNSEGDGLSGLTIERFNQVCVVSSSAYWVESNKELIINLLKETLNTDEILWFPQEKALAQDGWKKTQAYSSNQIECIKEEGIYFEVQFANAQKTGLFLDQRENHVRIAKLAKGKRVLDLYSYSGGFALHAAKAGAKHVTAVDSSANAIAALKKNMTLNQIDNIEAITGDARDFLVKANDYDLIILDPPKLVPSKQHIQRAKNYYRFLHREVFKAMLPGSLLMTCNCSSALDTQAFTELVYLQAAHVDKAVRILGVFGPAYCHPTLPVFPEGNYLTAVLLGIV